MSNFLQDEDCTDVQKISSVIDSFKKKNSVGSLETSAATTMASSTNAGNHMVSTNILQTAKPTDSLFNNIHHDNSNNKIMYVCCELFACSLCVTIGCGDCSVVFILFHCLKTIVCYYIINAILCWDHRICTNTTVNRIPTQITAGCAHLLWIFLNIESKIFFFKALKSKLLI